MARKKAHEDHVNHEAWAIPYGDLITLLLAFFVVMYAVSSINEGKYRVLSESLSEAFGGKPRTMQPIQLGKIQPQGSRLDSARPSTVKSSAGPVSAIPVANWKIHPQMDRLGPGGRNDPVPLVERASQARAQAELQQISSRVEEALAGLIKTDVVSVNRAQSWLEVEIKSDFLFASGVAEPQAEAVPKLQQLAEALRPFPNPVRIEGYTDNFPIRSLQFPSNWELSAARAASVLHVFAAGGIEPARMAVIGYGEQRPRADNKTSSGRTLNRRVVIVILASVNEDGSAPEQNHEKQNDGRQDNRR